MVKRILMPYRDEIRLEPYLEAARAVGLNPDARLPHSEISLDGYSGLLLTGGTDVNPKRYGELPQPETEAPDDERDTCELTLLHQAIERNMPILAICRGHQLLNVYHGGTLIQHLASGRHVKRSEDKGAPAHEVTVEPDSLLSSITRANLLPVNSRHHQAVGQIGKGLRVVATAPEDGVIEALERPDRRFVLAVQWHPENQIFDFPEQKKLFQAFADAL